MSDKKISILGPIAKKGEKTGAPEIAQKEVVPEIAHVKHEALYFVMTIVPNGQAGAIVSLYNAAECALSCISSGKGTATSDFYEVFGFDDNSKQVVLGLVKEERWGSLKSALNARFQISQVSRGVAAAVRLDSLCGRNAYSFVANSRPLTQEKEEENNKGAHSMDDIIEKKDDYELVMAIVNDGFTDLVMDAAKKAGARGGTILTARGTGNKDIANFFGVVITPEKQIVMILVPRDIKDTVISRIYRDVGINTKGQGIAFAMPVTDVVGIVEHRPDDEEVETGAK
jgi:nitrogen regulatory protein PII